MESQAPNSVRSLPPLLTIEEVADIARTSTSTVRHWITVQRLASVRPGRRRLVRLADLARFLGVGADELRR